MDGSVRTPERVSAAGRIRHTLAAVVYTGGWLVCSVMAANIFVDVASGSSLSELFGLIAILVPWWITAGIGIRLGLTPRGYARGVARLLGF